MKKEFYKLSLVFIMIIFSFSLAFFLGREITVSDKQKTKDPDLFKDTTKQFDNNSSPANLLPEKEEQTQREKVNEYKKTLHDEQNKKQTTSNKELETKQSELKQKSKKPDEIYYGLLITTHDDKESAMEKSTQLKTRFPQWRIFFKKSENSYKVYIGPFSTDAMAKKIMNELKKKPEFSHLKVEKI